VEKMVLRQYAFVAVLIWPLLAPVVGAKASASASPKPSVFDQELQKVRYGSSFDFSSGSGNLAASFSDSGVASRSGSATMRPKSPAKAFVLSFLVPGLGQYYNGNRIKPFLFLGVELAAWTLEIKFHGQGDDITAEFEAFNREHWLRGNYENKFLLWTYHATDDDSLQVQEISHHLPDTRTQQYYEMTGKYDQFAWGWDDANIDGRKIDDYSQGDPPPTLVERVPYSARRLWYENRRYDANSKFNTAKNMIIVSMVNHLVSAFEAYFAAKARNNALPQADREFSRLAFRADLRSIYTRYDTPFVRCTYMF
jgi:hypothetical protein